MPAVLQTHIRVPLLGGLHIHLACLLFASVSNYPNFSVQNISLASVMARGVPLP
jgi:hypothetical protein